ncbi:MAG: preprotein translocase subunit YajC [Thermoactinomyces sp.]|jgi:preprotein translocase subunit YajC
MKLLYQLAPLILFLFIFYFLIIRPNNRQRKEKMEMLNNLRKGDKVITAGGIHGTVVDLNEERVTLKVNDNTRITFERYSIDRVVNQEDKQEAKKQEEKKQEEKEN